MLLLAIAASFALEASAYALGRAEWQIILISRAENRPDVRVAHFSLRDAMPAIPVPLRDQAHARLDLKAALDRIYDAAGYEDYIYDGEPQPRLAPDDASWARQYVPVIH